MSAASLSRLSYGFMFAAQLFISCHNNQVDTGAKTGIGAEEAGRYLGTYSGSFNKGIITLVINYISGKTVSGYNIHKGLRRNINGEVTRNGSLLSFVLSEPGDNPYDGTFYFTLDTADLAIRGKWVSRDSIKIKTKTLALSRKMAAGDADDYAQWAAGGDSVLNFNDNGTCEFSFYERPSDSASQMMTIRGNYERKTDTFRIEWEKNTHTPAQSMKMIVAHIRQDAAAGGSEYGEIRLRGGGWDFYQLIGD